MLKGQLASDVVNVVLFFFVMSFDGVRFKVDEGDKRMMM